MLEFSAPTPGKGETLHAALLRMPNAGRPSEKHTRLTDPLPSVREFLKHRQSAVSRAEKKDLSKMIVDLREQLLRVEATIRIFRRMEASKRRASSARPSSRVGAAWTTPRRVGGRPSSV